MTSGRSGPVPLRARRRPVWLPANPRRRVSPAWERPSRRPSCALRQAV